MLACVRQKPTSGDSSCVHLKVMLLRGQQVLLDDSIKNTSPQSTGDLFLSFNFLLRLSNYHKNLPLHLELRPHPGSALCINLKRTFSTPSAVRFIPASDIQRESEVLRCWLPDWLHVACSGRLSVF